MPKPFPVTAWPSREGPARVQFAKLVPAALTENQVQLTFVGHSTFLIESSGGLRIATDFSGSAGGIVPDVITMNRAHRSHYTPTPRSRDQECAARLERGRHPGPA